MAKGEMRWLGEQYWFHPHVAHETTKRTILRSTAGSFDGCDTGRVAGGFGSRLDQEAVGVLAELALVAVEVETAAPEHVLGRVAAGAVTAFRIGDSAQSRLLVVAAADHEGDKALKQRGLRLAEGLISTGEANRLAALVGGRGEGAIQVATKSRFGVRCGGGRG
jgi:hypothetical protein